MPDAPYDVLAQLDLKVGRSEAIRNTEPESLGNGNWHLWTADDEHLILRRYHVLRTEEDLAYEWQVLHHLTSRGWSVPTPVAGPVAYEGRLWAVSRFVPGQPRLRETPAQRAERGIVLAGLHADLRELELGQRPNFFQGCDLENMADFQDWEPGLAGLRDVRPDLADWSAAAMEKAKATIAEHNVLQLPQGVVHGDFAEWNVHFTDDGVPAGVIDFDLTHQDSRVWEFTIARVYRSPELLDGYQREATRRGIPLTDEELAAIKPLQGIFRVHMVVAELWAGAQTGQYDLEMIDSQLARTETARP